MPSTSRASVDGFLALKRLAVAGVSSKPADFSRAVFRKFVECGYDAIPVNPNVHGGRRPPLLRETQRHLARARRGAGHDGAGGLRTDCPRMRGPRNPQRLAAPRRGTGSGQHRRREDLQGWRYRRGGRRVSLDVPAGRRVSAQLPRVDQEADGRLPALIIPSVQYRATASCGTGCCAPAPAIPPCGRHCPWFPRAS